jgi:putative ATPase
MVILAAEDVGLANPNALLMANNCFQAVHQIGMPEGRIIMSQTAIYLACSPKSNSAYLAIDEALAHVRQHPNIPVPLKLRNAPTKLMKELGYGDEYAYAHQYEGNFTPMECLPEGMEGTSFYTPGDNPAEHRFAEMLQKWWGNKYRKKK